MVPRNHAWKGHIWSFLILTTAIAAIPPERTLNRTGSLLELPSQQFHSHNSSLPEIEIGRAVCDPIRAGSLLRRTSCEEAATRIPISDLIIRFARRGPTIHEVQIPRRFSSADGTCVIDIFLPRDVRRNSDMASWSDIGKATRKILSNCVVGPNHEGGYVAKIGTHGNLIVSITKYHPHVLCYGTVPSQPRFSVSQELLDQIPTSSDDLFFGPSGLPGVEAVIPKIFRSHRGWDEFDAVVDAIYTTAKGVWLDLWAGAAAINAMCVGTSGRAGVAVMAGGLKVTLASGIGGLRGVE